MDERDYNAMNKELQEESSDISNTMLTDEQFKDWYQDKLIVTRYPVLNEIVGDKPLYKNIDVVINVSDEFWMDYVNAFWKNGKQNHWFPMGEINNDIGLPSIFGALWVTHQAFKRNLSVLIHCHAGANRSPTIKACFYYMMTNEHLPERKVNGIIRASNMLFYNCEYKHLPELSKMELFLKACKTAFDDPDKFLGGMYDWTLRESGIA